MSFTPEAFDSFVEALAAANNLSSEEAGEFAAQIGDTPEEMDDGKVAVRTGDGIRLLFLPGADV